jgi:hypothetical protein
MLVYVNMCSMMYMMCRNFCYYQSVFLSSSKWCLMKFCFCLAVTCDLMLDYPLLLFWSLVAMSVLRSSPITTRVHSSDVQANITVPIAAMSSSSDGQMK